MSNYVKYVGGTLVSIHAPTDGYPIYFSPGNFYEVGNIALDVKELSTLQYDELNNFFYFNYKFALLNDVSISIAQTSSPIFLTQGFIFYTYMSAQSASGPLGLDLHPMATLNTTLYNAINYGLLLTRNIPMHDYNINQIVSGTQKIYMVNMVTKSFTDATPTIITYNTYTFQAYFYNRPDLENGSLNLNINIIDSDLLYTPFSDVDHVPKDITDGTNSIISQHLLIYNDDNLSLYQINNNLLMELSGTVPFADGGQTRTFIILPFTFNGKIQFKDGLYYFYNISLLYDAEGGNEIGFLDIYTTSDFISYTKLNTDPLPYVDVTFDIVTNTVYYYKLDNSLVTLDGGFNPTVVFNGYDALNSTVVDGSLLQFYITYDGCIAVNKFNGTGYALYYQAPSQSIDVLNCIVKKIGNCIIVMPNAGEYQIYSVNPIQFGCSIQSIDNGVTWVNFSAGEYPAFTGGVMVLYKTHSRTFGSDGIYLLSIDMNYIYFGYQSSDITFTANKISLNESTGYYEIVTELGSITTTANAAAPLTLEDEELAFLNELDGYMGEMVVSHTNKECVVLLMLPTASKLGYAGEINYLICSYT